MSEVFIHVRWNFVPIQAYHYCIIFSRENVKEMSCLACELLPQITLLQSMMLFSNSPRYQDLWCSVYIQRRMGHRKLSQSGAVHAIIYSLHGHLTTAIVSGEKTNRTIGNLENRLLT